SLRTAPKVERQGIENDLVNLGEPAIGPLIKSLEDPDALVRDYAANILSGLGDLRAVEPLYRRLVDEDDDVRITAAHGLVRLVGISLLRLIDDLRASDARLRGSAALMLGELGNRQAVQPLIAHL